MLLNKEHYRKQMDMSETQPISGEKDDLWIFAVGTDTNCLTGPETILENKKQSTERIEILRYYYDILGGDTELEDNCLKWFDNMAQTNAKQLYNLLNKSKIDSDYVMERDLAHGLPFKNINQFKKIRNNLENILLSKDEANIIVDITEITDEDIIGLFYHLDKPQINIKLAYAEPAEGKPPMSYGSLNYGQVPPFIGELNKERKRLAVIFGNNDIKPILTMEQHLNATETIVLSPKPSFHKNWDKLSKRKLKGLKTFYNLELKEVSGINPLEVKMKLDEIYDLYAVDNGRAIHISIQGTKWQTVGTYLFLRGKLGEDHAIGLYHHTPEYSFNTKFFGGHNKIREFAIPRKS